MALPAGVGERYSVYRNGIRQRPGRDFRVEHGVLVFTEPVVREGRLGFWRWASMFLGVAGTYRRNDAVDVVYDAGGRRVVATGLQLVPDE